MYDTEVHKRTSSGAVTRRVDADVRATIFTAVVAVGEAKVKDLDGSSMTNVSYSAIEACVLFFRASLNVEDSQSKRK